MLCVGLLAGLYCMLLHVCACVKCYCLLSCITTADAEAKEQGETDVPIRAHRRRIARTRVSERVRHRIQIFRLNERRPLELMSSEVRIFT